jgi:hypothetical protein
MALNAVSFELPKMFPYLESAAYAMAKPEARSKVFFIISGGMVVDVCEVSGGIYIFSVKTRDMLSIISITYWVGIACLV